MIEGSSSPLYIQIADQLRHEVKSGDYKIDERLPAEAQLAEKFEVNRHTLRRIALLKQERHPTHRTRPRNLRHRRPFDIPSAKECAITNR